MLSSLAVDLRALRSLRWSPTVVHQVMILITELADGRDPSGPRVSGLLIEAAGVRVLVDPGGSSRGEYTLPLALTASEHLDAIVLTHAHADHSAGLQAVMAAYPIVPVLATPSTVALLQLLGRFTDATLAHARPTPFYERCTFEPTCHGPAWTVRLLPAGHLLGAAMAVLETPEGCVVCSGDVSLASQYTVRRAARPRQQADVLVLESTYGDREFRPRGLEEARLVAQVRAALDRGGRVLIAASPLGTAQEILLTLAQARLQGKLAGVIWVDEVVASVNSVYAQHAPADYPRLARWIASHGNPFQLDDGLASVVGPRDRGAALQGPPAIIVTSSPTFRSGTSRFYAKALAEAADHLILAPAGGAARQHVEQTVAPRRVRCTIGTYGLMSHADGAALTALAARWHPKLVVINHGQPEAKAALQARLAKSGLHAIVARAGQPIGWPARAT